MWRVGYRIELAVNSPGIAARQLDYEKAQYIAWLAVLYF